MSQRGSLNFSVMLYCTLWSNLNVTPLTVYWEILTHIAVFLIDAKMYLTCLQHWKQPLPSWRTPVLGGFPALQVLSLHLASPSQCAFASWLLLPAQSIPSPSSLTKCSHLFLDFLAQPAGLMGGCISLGPVANNRHYYSWFKHKYI